MSKRKKPTGISPATRRVMEAMADTIIPSGGPDQPGALDLDLVDSLLEFMGQFPLGPRLFVIIFWMWEFCPIWSGRPARFSRLSGEERTRVLEDWELSRFSARRWTFMLFKSVLMATFYNNPRVWPHLGYKEGCMSQPPKPIPK